VIQPSLPGLTPSDAALRALDELDARMTAPAPTAVIKRPEKTSKAYIKEGRRYARVTNVIGLLDKSGPLTSWAGSVQLEADYEAAMVAFALTPAGATMEDFRDHMRRSLIDTWGTAIRKPEWTEDRPRLAHRVHKQVAADKGTLAHELLEWHIEKMVGVPDLGPEPTVSDEVRQLARSGWRFLKALHFDPISVERTMFLDVDEYGQPLEVAGTADLISYVSIDDSTGLRYGVPSLPFGVAVLDWKTSKGLYLEQKIQIAVYAHMAKLCGLVDHLVPGLVVRLPRERGQDARIYCVSPEDSELYWRIFRDLVRVYRMTKPIYDQDRRDYYREKRREESLNQE
jgi:hypothetical protein